MRVATSLFGAMNMKHILEHFATLALLGLLGGASVALATNANDATNAFHAASMAARAAIVADYCVREIDNGVMFGEKLNDADWRGYDAVQQALLATMGNRTDSEIETARVAFCEAVL